MDNTISKKIFVTSQDPFIEKYILEIFESMNYGTVYKKQISDIGTVATNEDLNLWIIYAANESFFLDTQEFLNEISNKEINTIVFSKSNIKSDIPFNIKLLNNVVDKYVFTNALFKFLNSSEPVSLLIVDDIEDNRFVLKSYLAEYNCVVFEAANGNEAKELIKNQKFDLILLDYLLPDINGDEILEYLRNGLKKETPVLIFSGQNELENVKKVASIGISGYLVKPLRIDEFIKKIQQVIPISIHDFKNKEY
jgi:CheY-like chemotaxis protein